MKDGEIKIRCSEEDKERYAKQAKQMGFSGTSEYIRNLLESDSKRTKKQFKKQFVYLVHLEEQMNELHRFLDNKIKDDEIKSEAIAKLQNLFREERNIWDV